MKTKRTFTDAQLGALSKYEQNFRTAVFSQYARRVGGPEDAMTIGRIYAEATGINLPVYASCQDCMLRLLTQVGRAYLQDLDTIEKERIEEAAKRVVSVEPAETQIKPAKLVRLPNQTAGRKASKPVKK